MIKWLNDKLNNNTGASIIFALLMMLIAAMVAAVVVSAALTGAQSVRNDYDEEQAFLTVESAERLIETDIDGGVLTLTRTIRKD